MRAWPIALLLIFTSHAHAWGDAGHRITAHIANALLHEHSRERLTALVGTDDLSQIATALDDERDALERRVPGSSRWHYENRQVCPRTPTSRPQCPNGQCVTRQIDTFLRTVRDPRATREQQADAVRGLAHLIGDLHQPLHLADHNDRGGNDLKVKLPNEKKPRNLHEAWDSRFLRMNLGRRSEQRYAAALAAQFASQFPAWRTGDSESWAAESHLLAKEQAYFDLPDFACGKYTDAIVLPETYISQARMTVDLQLAKAGVRLATLLNDALNDAFNEVSTGR